MHRLCLDYDGLILKQQPTLPTSDQGFEENCVKVIRTLLLPMENSNEISPLGNTQSLDNKHKRKTICL